MTRRPLTSLLGLLLAGTLVVAGCDDSPARPDELALEGTVDIYASIQSPSVSTLVVEVTGPGIPDPQVFNLEIVGNDTDGDGVEDQFTAEGLLSVPAGGNRTFEVRAFDEAGIRTHEGSATMHVTPGANASAVAVSLIPLTGDKPIDIVLGSFDVTVTPGTATIAVRDTQRFTARTLVENADLVKRVGKVAWATTNPGVATVDRQGLVTALAPGTARIVANWMGSGDEAEITVGDDVAPPPESYLGTYRLSSDGVPGLNFSCPAPPGLGDFVDFSTEILRIVGATPDQLQMELELENESVISGLLPDLELAAHLDAVRQSFSIPGSVRDFSFSGSANGIDYEVSGSLLLDVEGEFADGDFSGPLQMEMSLRIEAGGTTLSDGECVAPAATIVTGSRISN